MASVGWRKSSARRRATRLWCRSTHHPLRNSTCKTPVVPLTQNLKTSSSRWTTRPPMSGARSRSLRHSRAPVKTWWRQTKPQQIVHHSTYYFPMLPHLATLCILSAGAPRAFEQTPLTSVHLKMLEDGRLGTRQMIQGVPFAQPCFDDQASASCAHIKQLYTDEGVSFHSTLR